MRQSVSGNLGTQSFRAGASGAAAVEFALVLPAFFLFVFGLIQAGILVYEMSNSQWAMERAVRIAMVDKSIDATTFEALVESELVNIGAPADVTVAFSVDSSGAMDIIHVQVFRPFFIDLPFAGKFDAGFTSEDYFPRLKS